MCRTTTKLISDLASLNRSSWLLQDVDRLYEQQQFWLYKALRLDNPREFDKAVAAIAKRWSRLTSTSDRKALAAALRDLDINWAEASASKRSSAIRSAARKIKLPGAVRVKLVTDFGKTVDDIVRAVKRNQRAEGLKVALTFTEADKTVVRAVRDMHENFVRDEYGRRQALLSARVRKTVSEGLEVGLATGDIALRVQKVAEGVVARAKSYWMVTSSAFVSRSRSYSELAGYTEAAIEKYQILAVSDENTTEICRMLDGKIFSVKTANRQFDRAARSENPETIRQINPWVYQTEDRLWIDKAGKKRTLATVKEPGFGTKESGVYNQKVSDTTLQNSGVSFPPFHGLCRSTTVPVV